MKRRVKIYKKKPSMKQGGSSYKKEYGGSIAEQNMGINDVTGQQTAMFTNKLKQNAMDVFMQEQLSKLPQMPASVQNTFQGGGDLKYKAYEDSLKLHNLGLNTFKREIDRLTYDAQHNVDNSNKLRQQRINKYAALYGISPKDVTPAMIKKINEKHGAGAIPNIQTIDDYNLPNLSQYYKGSPEFNEPGQSFSNPKPFVEGMYAAGDAYFGEEVAKTIKEANRLGINPTAIMGSGVPGAIGALYFDKPVKPVVEKNIDKVPDIVSDKEATSDDVMSSELTGATTLTPTFNVENSNNVNKDPIKKSREVIDPYADIDLEDISEEKTYNPIQASYKRGSSGNTTRGNIGYTYGYQSDPSSLEFQNQSPYGNKDIYQLRAGDKVSVFDKNIDPLVEEHMNYLNARKAAENMEPIVSFAHGGATSHPGYVGNPNLALYLDKQKSLNDLNKSANDAIFNAMGNINFDKDLKMKTRFLNTDLGRQMKQEYKDLNKEYRKINRNPLYAYEQMMPQIPQAAMGGDYYGMGGMYPMYPMGGAFPPLPVMQFAGSVMSPLSVGTGNYLVDPTMNQSNQGVSTNAGQRIREPHYSIYPNYPYTVGPRFGDRENESTDETVNAREKRNGVNKPKVQTNNNVNQVEDAAEQIESAESSITSKEETKEQEVTQGNVNPNQKSDGQENINVSNRKVPQGNTNMPTQMGYQSPLGVVYPTVNMGFGRRGQMPFYYNPSNISKTEIETRRALLKGNRPKKITFTHSLPGQMQQPAAGGGMQDISGMTPDQLKEYLGTFDQFKGMFGNQEEELVVGDPDKQMEENQKSKEEVAQILDEDVKPSANAVEVVGGIGGFDSSNPVNSQLQETAGVSSTNNVPAMIPDMTYDKSGNLVPSGRMIPNPDYVAPAPIQQEAYTDDLANQTAYGHQMLKRYGGRIIDYMYGGPTEYAYGGYVPEMNYGGNMQIPMGRFGMEIMQTGGETDLDRFPQYNTSYIRGRRDGVNASAMLDEIGSGLSNTLNTATNAIIDPVAAGFNYAITGQMPISLSPAKGLNRKFINRDGSLPYEIQANDPNNFVSAQPAGSRFQEGGEYELTDAEIQAIIQAGGEIEYL